MLRHYLTQSWWEECFMVFRRVCCVLLALCLCAPLCALAEDDEAFELAITKAFKSYKTVGAALYVAKDGEIVYHRLYGYADKRAKEQVTEETYFRTASVTKLISGIHVMQLVERGLIDLDEGIGDYLGYEVYNPKAQKAEVTLRHLMTHTSSLNPYGAYSTGKYALSEILTGKRRKGSFYEEKPGSKYRYSNFGAGIMGSLIETVSGKNLNDSITEDLFTPLGMDAAFHPSLLKHPSRISTQYGTDGSVIRARSRALASEWDAAADPERHIGLTIGSLWFKGVDLCRVGMLLCNGGSLDGKTILKPETVAEMMADQKDKGAVKISSPYGLCVNRMDNLVKGRLIYGHQGMSEGLLCNIYYDPDTSFVFAMISNGCNNKLSDRIANLSRRLFDLCWQRYSGAEDEVIR